MNIIQLQDNLKNLSDQQLTQAMQMPAQDTPPFLVVSELNRRKKMRDSFQAQQADQNKTTVAQDVVAAAGVPQGPASEMAQSLAPKTDMTNNTGIMSIPQGGQPQRMAGGGVVKMQAGKTPPAAGMTTAYDYTTGKFITVPTLGAQLSGIGTAIMNQGNPYSQLTPEEIDAVSNGDMSPEEADKLQAARTAAATPAPVAPPVAPTTPPVVTPEPKKDPEGGGGGGGGGGSAKPSDYEQAIMDALKNADKKATQDKWMTLAQMGLSMMSSQQPNFLASVGEAGAAAIPAFQKARDTADDTKLGLNKGLYDIAMQRQARNDALAAASAKANAKSSGGFGVSADAVRRITAAKTAVDVAAQNLTQLGYQPGMDPADPSFTPERQMEIKTALNDYQTAMSSFQMMNAILNSGLMATGSEAPADPTSQQDLADPLE
jgi:hypothetical protein